MTDARFPERWLNDRRLIRLNDSAFRTFVLGLTWAVANRTDGYIDRDDLDLIHGASPDQGEALVAAGLIEPSGDGWVWVDFAATQTSRAQLEGLEQRRESDRVRSRRYRERKREDPPPDPPPSRDSSRDDIGQARPGQAGQDRQRLRKVTTGRAGVTDQGDAVRGNGALSEPWPEVVQPGSKSRRSA